MKVVGYSDEKNSSRKQKIAKKWNEGGGKETIEYLTFFRVFLQLKHHSSSKCQSSDKLTLPQKRSPQPGSSCCWCCCNNNKLHLPKKMKWGKKCKIAFTDCCGCPCSWMCRCKNEVWSHIDKLPRLPKIGQESPLSNILFL